MPVSFNDVITTYDGQGNLKFAKATAYGYSVPMFRYNKLLHMFLERFPMLGKREGSSKSGSIEHAGDCDTIQQKELSSVFERFALPAVFGTAAFLCMIFLHVAFDLFQVATLPGSVFVFPTFAYVLGGLAVFTIGFVFGTSIICKPYPLSCLVGSIVAFICRFAWSFHIIVEDLNYSGLILTIKEAIVSYWPHYLLFFGCVFALCIVIFNRKREKPISLNRPTYHALVIAAAIFVILSFIIINFVLRERIPV
ncbi:MAG: hypothetical protein FWD65_00130 [Coriobacteriia bacterium]|nr:hypothetical protein [Coriobacteriia bacterium]